MLSGKHPIMVIIINKVYMSSPQQNKTRRLVTGKWRKSHTRKAAEKTVENNTLQKS